MHRFSRFVLALACCTLAVYAGTSKADAEALARGFVAALTSADAAALRPLLPERGKVRVALERFADARGSYGAGQVEALFRQALARVVVRSFDTLRVESDETAAALVHCRVALQDREGRPTKLALHLSMQAEGGAWVIREIRESSE